MTLRAATVAFVVALAAACGPAGGRSNGPVTRPSAATASAAPGEPAKPSRCVYDVTVMHPTAHLDVEARCDGPTTGFMADPHLLPFTADVRDENGRPLARTGTHWALAPGGAAHIRYRVDLDAAAREERNFDTALSVGRSLVAPLSSYVLAPEPADRLARIIADVHAGDGESFVTDLPKEGSGYSIALSDVREATYGVFGRFEHDVLSLPGVHAAASLDVISLDAPFDLARDARVGWVRRRAEAVARFYGGFPAGRAGVVLAPVEGRRDVVFGKVLSGGASTIVVLLGARADQRALEGDWVLVHEMFHLGFPSFNGEGRWLDEGLATYAEPLIRARAGMLTEEEGWAEVVRDMPLGVHLCETAGLEHPGDDIRAIYWGGAVVALLADVEARRRTHGERGLEDALRDVLAKGWDATHVMRLTEAIRLVDDALGSAVLAPLAAKYADHGSPVPLDAVLADLGVERHDRTVHLRADAPLAAVRRAIMYGSVATTR